MDRMSTSYIIYEVGNKYRSLSCRQVVNDKLQW